MNGCIPLAREDRRDSPFAVPYKSSRLETHSGRLTCLFRGLPLVDIRQRDALVLTVRLAQFYEEPEGLQSSDLHNSDVSYETL